MSSADEIAATLRDRIHSGALVPGDRLPTMTEISAEYGVSRPTASAALAILKREGIAEYRPGRGPNAGTYVRQRPTAPMIRSRGMERDHLGYYSGPEVQHWRAVPGTQTERATLPVPADLAKLLGVGPGTLVAVRKRLNGDPDPGREQYRQLTDSWLHPDAVTALPMLTGDSGLGGIYDRIEEWAGAPISWEEQISGATPSPAESSSLLLPSGVSLLRVIRISTIRIDGRNLVAEVNDIRMSAELFAVRYPLPRRGAARWPVEPATSDYYGSPTQSG